MTRDLGPTAYAAIGRLFANRTFGRFHASVYRRVGGRGIAGRSLGIETIVLATTGRRTGRRREAALYAFRDPVRAGERPPAWVVVPTHGGRPTEPAWWGNLRVEPAGEVHHRGDRWPVRARVADPEETERLWDRILDAYPGYDLYRRWAGRPIPLVILEPGRHDGSRAR
jgi:deazaflavin-dependent oxidoreductase (nitroreductase family)